MKDFKTTIDNLIKVKEHVVKNFNEMDFENCDLRDNMLEHINKIVNHCDEMIEYCELQKKALR